jgi:hypothetical protein
MELGFFAWKGEKMNHFYSLKIIKISLLVVFALMLFGCGERGDKQGEKKRGGLELELLSLGIDTEIILLSIKYNIEIEKAQNAIKDYHSFVSIYRKSESDDYIKRSKQTDEEKRKVIDAWKKEQSIISHEKFKSQVLDISSKYNIPPQILASMLIDYYAMQSKSGS